MNKQQKSSPVWWQLLAPWHWPTWFAFYALRPFSRLPYPLMLRFGRVLGRLLYRLWGSRRKIVEHNLKCCFPELSESERSQLCRENFASLGIGLFEMTLSWWGPEEVISKLSHVTGLDYLEAARAKNKGVILLCAHFTTIEISGRFLRQLTEFTPIYRKSQNPVAEHEIVRWRTRKLGPMISRDNLRDIIRTMRRNGVIWTLPDQNTKRGTGVFVKFFGIDASTTTSVSRLAKMSGAAIVPFLFTRRSDGSGYDLRFYPELEEFPSDDLTQDAQRITQIIEAWARAHPEQYFWIHRRFRTRPTALDPPFYPK